MIDHGLPKSMERTSQVTDMQANGQDSLELQDQENISLLLLLMMDQNFGLTII